MGPLIPLEVLGPEWDYISAILIGFVFGFALEQAGFSSSRKLVGVFYGYDFVVLKVFFTAAITGMIGLFFMSYFGAIDLSIIYVNSLFLWPTIIGGGLIGVGFVMGGFCPGTAFAGASIGKIDAMVFIGGIVLGIFFYAETFTLLWKTLFMSSPMGHPLIHETLGISRGVFMFLLIIVALLTFWGTAEIQKRVSKHEKY
jgi:uncharacterized membrane protein YedE/YeeE